jgi:2-C-methyl-D-erythritol 4-phosphate cytidylyltransferase
LSFALLVPAAGSGERLGAKRPKALLEIAGIPLVVRAVRPFLSFPECTEVLVAAPREYLNELEIVTSGLSDKRVRVILGGTTRQDSVGLALAALESECNAVMVHDAARPLVSRDLIAGILAEFKDDVTAVLPGLPVTDTLKLVREQSNDVERTLPRDRIYTVQTPQMIRLEPFRAAHRKAKAAGFIASDDVALIEAYEKGTVRVLQGDEQNFKITTPTDLERARSILAAATIV